MCGLAAARHTWTKGVFAAGLLLQRSLAALDRGEQRLHLPARREMMRTVREVICVQWVASHTGTTALASRPG